MCGILGFLGPLGSAFEPSERAIQVLRRRGPDFISRKKYSEMGFEGWQSRLRIHDENPSGDEIQESERYVVLFNGELYNFGELAKLMELDAQNITEGYLILVGLERYERQIFDRLHGMFALIIFDKLLRELSFLRDPIGIKPLFYRLIDDSLIVGSQQSMIIDLKEQPYGSGCALAKIMGCSGFDLTPYPDLWSCTPGYIYSWRYGDESIARTQYFYIDNIVFDILRDRELDHDILIEDCAKEIAETVGRVANHGREFNEETSALMLSGGCDSALIVGALDPNYIPYWIFLDFLNNDLESERVKKLAEKFNREVSVHEVQKQLWLDTEDEFLAYADNISIDGENMFLGARFLSRLKKKVVILGTGGDEIFGAYNTFKKNRILNVIRRFIGSKYLYRIVSLLYPGRTAFAEFVEDLSGNTTLGNYILIRSILKRGESVDIEDMIPDERLGTRIIELGDEIRMIESQLSHDHGFSWAEMRLYLEPMLLRDADWTSMHFSIEARVPLLELSVLRAAWALFDSRQDARNSVVDVIAGEEFNSKHSLKAGFSPPLSFWRTSASTGVQTPLQWIQRRLDFRDQSNEI